MNILTYDNCVRIGKRLRYKHIDNTYCHLVLQGFRYESDCSNNYTITCITKCGSPRISNNTPIFKEIIYITDFNSEIIYNKKLFKDAMNNIYKYINAHKKLRRQFSDK